MVSLKYDRAKIAKEIAKAADVIIRTETGVDIPDDVAEVKGVIVIRFKKDGASSTVMGNIRLRDAADIFDQLLQKMVIDKPKGERIAVS